MNKFVHSAIALTAVSASAFATDNGWVSLDQEINNLNASLSAQNATGPKVGGFLRTRWSTTGDVVEPVQLQVVCHRLWERIAPMRTQKPSMGIGLLDRPRILLPSACAFHSSLLCPLPRSV